IAVMTSGVRESWTEKWQLATSPSSIDIGAVPRLDVVPGAALGLQLATASIPGGMQLSGDLGGTAAAPQVVGVTHLSGALPSAVDAGSAQVTATGSTTARAIKDHLATLPDAKITPTGGAVGRSLSDITADVMRAKVYAPGVRNTLVLHSFDAPGAATHTIGMRGEPALNVRASTAYLPRWTGEVASANNTVRVQDYVGALLEGARTQSFVNPDAPATQTVTLANGTYTASIEGSGSMALAVGTATAAALPLTATASTPATFTVTAPGTVIATIAGTVTFAQIENGAFKTSKIHGASRAADNVTVLIPLYGPSDTSWLVDGVFTMGFGRAWDQGGGGYATLWAAGTFSAANSIYAYISGSTLTFSIYDNAAAVKTLTYTFASGLGSGVSHRITLGSNNGALLAWIDGKPVGSVVGAGTGIVTVWPTAFYLGYWPGAAGRELYGYLRSFSVSRGATIADVPLRAPVSVATLGDSITAGNGGASPYPLTLQQSLGPGYVVSNGGVAGTTTAQMLDRWQRAIGPWNPDVFVLLGGVNDLQLNHASAASIEANLQAMYDDAITRGARVIAVPILPYKGYAGWVAGDETTRVAVNAWIAAYCAARPTQMTFMDLATLMDDGTGALQGGYDSGDHLHPNAAGFTLMANTIRAAFP
ncbi:MAG TPA: SGNH/GDSL hydrolase family protein, partial [Humisphaera sp.]